MDGWVKLHRSIIDNWTWSDKPFSKGQAWMDLIIMANHKDNKFPLGNEIVTVERGSLITSELKLMERWGWSKSKVRLFLKQLQNDSMLVKKTDRKKTILTIVNYGVYQESETTERPLKDHLKTDSRPLKDTNKNVKNVKNVKKEINTYFAHDEKLNQAFLDFMEMRKKIKAPMTERAITMMINKINKHDNDTAIQMLENSIINNWKDIYPLKEDGKKPKSTNKFNNFLQREYTSQQISDIERALINKGLED